MITIRANQQLTRLSMMLDIIKEVIANVTTGLITYSIRDTEFEDVSIKQGDYIGICNGKIVTSNADRIDSVKKLLEHGFATTMNKTFYQPGDAIAEIPVWYGRQDTVTATVAKPFTITVSKEDGLKGVRVLARYDEPVNAPIRAGDEIGQLVAEQNGHVLARAPLVAKNKVSKIQFLGRVIKNIKVMFGW